MKVLTVKTIETVASETQVDIHYTLGMEHYTDYVFQAKEALQYTATISMDDTKEVIEKIIAATAQLPEYNFIIDELDINKDLIERLVVKNSEILEKKSGNLEWGK